MASVRREVLLAAPMDAVWDAVRDVGALHTRLVPGFVVDTQLVEGARIVTFANGMRVREPIISIDDEQHRVSWAAVDTPMTHYSASFQLFQEGANTRGVWISDLLPHDAAAMVSEMMEQGLAAMKRVFGDGSRSKS